MTAHSRTPANSQVVWPTVPFNVVLVEPEIPPNTGNIARLCAATGTILHLAGPLGFQMTDKHLKRAGLDYWDKVVLRRHVTWEDCMRGTGSASAYYFSKSGARLYTDVEYQPGDYLVFGSESSGLPASAVATNRDRLIAIPMVLDAVRSLNLATAVGIVLYEAIRQNSAHGQ